jgi:hypothetical protein
MQRLARQLLRPTVFPCFRSVATTTSVGPAQMVSNLSSEPKEPQSQRNTYEDILKLSASKLSNKTEATDLVKLLELTSFIDL